MSQKIYQTTDGKIKTVFFGQKELIFSTEKIEIVVQFTNLYKHPSLIEKATIVRFDEIKYITFIEDQITINAYIKIDSLQFKKSLKLSKSDLESFKEQIEELPHIKNTLKRRRIHRLLNHYGILVFITGVLFTYLIATEADFTTVQGKNKLFGYLFQKTIETLGFTTSISISLLITIYSLYSIWKLINAPYNQRDNKMQYSKLKLKSESKDKKLNKTVVNEVENIDFGGTTAELKLRKNGNGYLIVELPPFTDGEGNNIDGDEDFPELLDFEDLIAEYIGQRVERHDREVFIIPNATEQSLLKIKYFIENYWALRNDKYK
ncbi:hypothetical protein ACFSX9_13185 [Flavobacterium ardleyense]|uniref:Uncharacterized protein n=1 Tax=Flavobacterium ardleyense TaxID=2038737 RepID=A0ABW5ZB19_9FLAO